MVHGATTLTKTLPPSPAKHIDLLLAVRKQFKFPSNRLAYVSKVLLGESKVEHEGHQLWVDCMAGDEKAWRKMRAYNIQDIKLLEKLYPILQPWIPNHLSYGVITGRDTACTNCGSSDLRKEGRAFTSTGRYQRYQCAACGRWSRGIKREAGTQVTSIAA